MLSQRLSGPAELVAPRLLGCELIRTLPDGTTVSGRIVETEAYNQSDAASHSYKGMTARTAVMFGPAGHLYVYFTYGMHYCCNIVTGPAGEGSAVLIRAIEPLAGACEMLANRPAVHNVKDVALTNGPAKLCQALAIGAADNGHDLSQSPLTLRMQPPLPADQIVQSPRIGISRAVETPWRFFIIGNAYVSRV